MRDRMIAWYEDQPVTVMFKGEENSRIRIPGTKETMIVRTDRLLFQTPHDTVDEDNLVDAIIRQY